MDEPVAKRAVGVVLFDGFELLDVFGPLELFGGLADLFGVTLLGPDAGPVASAQGPAVLAGTAYRDARTPDVVLVPGGIGTRALVGDGEWLAWLRDWAGTAPIVTSVCTGAGVLAAAGLLDGYRATSNKRAFAWVTGQGPGVDWVPKARWVHDRDRWTSAGVSAGMDMTLALIDHLCGAAAASGEADRAEYDWHRDADWDPFAARNGLVAG